jgi:hypothetical protein
MFWNQTIRPSKGKRKEGNEKKKRTNLCTGRDGAQWSW